MPRRARRDFLKTTSQLFYQAPVHHLLQATPPVFLSKGQTRRRREDECGFHVLSYSCACAWLRRNMHTAATTGWLLFMVISHLPEGSPAERASRAEPRQPCETVGNKGTSSCPSGGGTASCRALNVSPGSLKVCDRLGSYRCICHGDHSRWETEMQFSRYALITVSVTGDSKHLVFIYNQVLQNKMYSCLQTISQYLF